VSGARPTIAIVGGGFSGAAVAFHLARFGLAEVLVFEPRARLGGGLAYGGNDPIHRVNVPAARMSLLPEDEGHFARWLQASGALDDDAQAMAGGEAYPRRREFGRYVAETISPHLASGAIRHVRGVVASLCRIADGWRLETAAGETRRADVVVIASTHPAPALPPGLRAHRDDPRVVTDPLVDNVVKDVSADDRVLIMGAGLTAADLVAALDAQGHRGLVTIFSRRGLRARGRSLTSFAPEGDFLDPPAHKASALLRRVRAAIVASSAAGRGWQGVIEGVRNQGQEIWGVLDPVERRRIARHLRPFWDAHRFRAAPQIEAIVEARLARGLLEVKRARLGAVARHGEAFAVELRDLRAGVSRTRLFDRILVAAGPAHRDILRSQPFLAELAAAGALALDATELGLRVARDGRAIGADGVADPTLFVAGPLARGTFGELMGLPQVSEYAQFIAQQVVDALPRVEQRHARRASGLRATGRG
jgi:uncharacterized NAD(P)/FAD-binding protein YdhS